MPLPTINSYLTSSLMQFISIFSQILNFLHSNLSARLMNTEWVSSAKFWAFYTKTPISKLDETKFASAIHCVISNVHVCSQPISTNYAVSTESRIITGEHASQTVCGEAKIRIWNRSSINFRNFNYYFFYLRWSIIPRKMPCLTNMLMWLLLFWTELIKRSMSSQM